MPPRTFTKNHPQVPKPPGSASTMTAKELSANFMKNRDANAAWAKPHLAPQEVKDAVPDTPASPTSDNTALPRPKHMRRGTIVVQGAPEKQREIFFPHYGEALRPFLAFKAHDGSVTGVQLIPDALTPALISWGFDGAVHAWAISNGVHLGLLLCGHFSQSVYLVMHGCDSNDPKENKWFCRPSRIRNIFFIARAPTHSDASHLHAPSNVLEETPQDHCPRPFRICYPVNCVKMSTTRAPHGHCASTKMRTRPKSRMRCTM